MMKNDNGEINPVIGVILLISITVILSCVIAAFLLGMITVITPNYNTTITVKDVIFTNGNYGVIDTNDNGYYFDSFHSFTVGNTYHIVYYISNDKRYIMSGTNINDLSQSDLFKCKYINGVCK